MRTVGKKINRKIVFFCLDFHPRCERLHRREIVNLPIGNSGSSPAGKPFRRKQGVLRGPWHPGVCPKFFGENVARIPSAFKRIFLPVAGLQWKKRAVWDFS